MPAGDGTDDTMTFAERLRVRLENGHAPVQWRAASATRDLAKWIAMHDNDREVLRQLAKWKADRAYKIDSLPSKISVAFSDFLYGEEPTILAANEENQERLDAIVEENAFTDGLRDAVDMCCAEGEVWWRIYTDPVQLPCPIIEWHSRTKVVPLWRGKVLLAAAFVSELERDREGVWRHVELHEEGSVQNLLYFSPNETSMETDTTVSTSQGIGQARPLTAHSATMELPDIWNHGLGMLVGRVVNKLGRNPELGVSDYAGVEDDIFDLNEAKTIDAENFRLAGKKRAVMPERFANADGNAEDADVYWAKEDWDEMDGDDKGPFKILEYSYDGASSIARKDDLTGTILTRVGLARQFVDANSREGEAVSGTNLRTRLIPTTLAAGGKARKWDPAAPDVLMRAQLVDNLPENNYGFGEAWTDPGDPPTVERTSILPEGQEEKVERHARAVGAGLESVETAVREMHPEWDEDEINAEVDRIRTGLLPPELDETSDEPTDDEPVPEEA